MKYKLYSDIKCDDMVEQILKNRGIEDINSWLDASMDNVSDWRLLDNMPQAVRTIQLAVEHNVDAVTIVDCDVDGYTSSAILINYLYSLYPKWVTEHFTYVQHFGKEHGMLDMYDRIPDNISLIIAPDSSSNDYEAHEYWNDKGVDIVILDHHLADHVSASLGTVTVNNQLCDYPNKEFSAAGVVWQFCRAYDELVGINGKKDIDLAALGLLSDMMSFKSIETKAIIIEGLNHIQNAFFQEMVNLNEYTINKYGGQYSYKAIAFGVTPFINATVRSGTEEEKDLVFRAMCDCYNQEMVPNTKRGYKGTEIETYKQAAYLTSAIKRRQAKAETESLAFFENQIEEKNLLDNAVLVLLCGPDDVAPTVRGLVANKMANRYQRPCLVLTETINTDDGKVYYCGSGRNYSMSEIQDLKSVEEATGEVAMVQGHNNAHGLQILAANLTSFINKMNQAYSNVPREATYWVDYIWNYKEVLPNNLLRLAQMSSFWGQDMPASQIVIEDIDLSQCQLRLCGQKNNTLRMVLPNGLVLVKFGIDEDDFKQLEADNMYMTAIVDPQANEWQGKVSGEGIIADYSLDFKYVF